MRKLIWVAVFVAVGSVAFAQMTRTDYERLLEIEKAKMRASLPPRTPLARPAAPVPKPVDVVATSFVLVDDKGTKRGALTMLGTKATLALYDGSERLRCTVQTDAAGETKWTKYDIQGQPIK